MCEWVWKLLRSKNEDSLQLWVKSCAWCYTFKMNRVLNKLDYVCNFDLPKYIFSFFLYLKIFKSFYFKWRHIELVQQYLYSVFPYFRIRFLSAPFNKSLDANIFPDKICSTSGFHPNRYSNVNIHASKNWMLSSCFLLALSISFLLFSFGY